MLHRRTTGKGQHQHQPDAIILATVPSIFLIVPHHPGQAVDKKGATSQATV